MSGAEMGGAFIWIQPAVLDSIREEARRASPQECCGILLGPAKNAVAQGGDGLLQPAPQRPLISAIMPAANIAADPERLFEIAPETLFAAYRAERQGAVSVVGFYHSHPRGEPVPSKTDQAMAPRDGKVWLIAGVRAIACWRDDQAGFSPLPYCLTRR